ncbi:uncharacterized protein LOC131926997 isoform X2 [Physella acuta]|uniref:uncharacterized protein LOC131926997 isoform X2 n=1 Tax=Physella acuta TaxID=109671 RepID=UPI0027DC9644|nr:uncharacterized protein LOC131926997 isoform X2 [Physella acuta]
MLLILALALTSTCNGVDGLLTSEGPPSERPRTFRPPSEPVHSFCNTSVVDLFPWSNVRVRSPVGEDGKYVSNLNCQLRFRTLDGPLLVTISFQDFDVELIDNCHYDFLCVNGVKFCGTCPKDQEYQFLVPAYENFTLTFATDVAVNKRGFQLSLQARMYTGGIVSTPTGVVNEWSSKNFTNVTLGSVYIDRCVNTPNPWLQHAITSPSYQHTTSTWYFDTNSPWYQHTSNPGYQHTTNTGYQHTSTVRPTAGNTEQPRTNPNDILPNPLDTYTWPPRESTTSFPTFPATTPPNPCYGHPCTTHPYNPNNPRNPYSIYAVMEAVQYLQQEQFNRDHVLSLLQLFLQHNRM